MDFQPHLKQGTRVMCNGYPGAIVREYSTRMYEVRLASGVCCVDISDIELLPPSQTDKLEAFRAKLEADTRAYYTADWERDQALVLSGDPRGIDYPLSVHEPAMVCTVKMGRKYANVDVGRSGRYMVDLSTGAIYGIKAYGVIHRGHYYGTLDTIADYDWRDYTAVKRQSIAA